MSHVSTNTSYYYRCMVASVTPVTACPTEQNSPAFCTDTGTVAPVPLILGVTALYSAYFRTHNGSVPIPLTCAPGFESTSGSCQPCALGFGCPYTYVFQGPYLAPGEGNVPGLYTCVDAKNRSSSASFCSFSVEHAVRAWCDTDPQCIGYASIAGGFQATRVPFVTVMGSTNGFVKTSTPVQCVPGQFQNVTGQSGCQVCRLGTFSAVFGATAASPCAAGTFGNTTGATTCFTCPVSTYCDTVGLSQPLPCYSNTHNVGQVTCLLACPLGTYGLNCALCPATGVYCNNTMDPVPCPAGSYGNASGLFSSSCSGLCPPSTFCPAGATAPIVCPNRTYAPVTGLSACLQCDTNLVLGASVCMPAARAPCPLGSFCPTIVTTVAGGFGLGFADGASPKFNTPTSVAMDTSNNVIVVDQSNHRIRSISPVGTVTTVAGSGLLQSVDGAGTNAGYRSPWGVRRVDASGTMYITDSGNNRLRRLTPTTTSGVTTWTSTTVAGSTVLGTNSYFLDDIGTKARLQSPQGMDLLAGTAYIADFLNNRVRVVLNTNNQVSTVAGGSVAGFKDGVGSMALFYGPASVVGDSSGNLFIADSQNHAIRKIALATGMVTTFAGRNFTWADGTGPSVAMYQPQGISERGHYVHLL